jgi:uncharacterized protein (DUF2336 family)
MIPHPTLIAELEHAIAHGTRQRRAEMLLQITDLFIHGSVQLSDDEIGLFDEVITRLAEHIEISVRSLLAERLAPIANAPFNITRMLAGDDEIRVAYPILVQSERLDEAALVQNALSKSQEHLLAISRRKSLSEAVTDVLVNRGNKQVALSTAKNAGAKFSEAGFCRLVKRSEGDDALAACVGSREDIPHPLFLALLETASEMVRSKLIAERSYDRHEIDHAVAMVADGLRKDAGVKSTTHLRAPALVESLGDLGQLGDEVIRAFTEEGKYEEATAALARSCRVPVEIIEQAMTQSRSERIVILAKAAELSWATTKALLLFRARQRPISTSEIEQCLASFERLNLSTARRIVEFYKIRPASKLFRPV